MTFGLVLGLQGQIQGQGTGYRMTFGNYVSTYTKKVSSDSYPTRAVYTTMIFHLEFYPKGQMTAY